MRILWLRNLPAQKKVKPRVSVTKEKVVVSKHKKTTEKHFTAKSSNWKNSMSSSWSYPTPCPNCGKKVGQS